MAMLQQVDKKLCVLGAMGFIGRETCLEALRQGFTVTVVVRDPSKADALAARGVRIVKGDAARAGEWIEEVAGCDVLIDLAQPALPQRIGLAEIKKVAAMRLSITDALVRALRGVGEASRPILFSVSGLDDLEPNEDGRVVESATLRAVPTGFAHVGIPVRRAIEKSGVGCAFIYLATVYGPGKAFAGEIFPKLAEGKFIIPGKGDNHMPLVHVEDTARALVHLAGLSRDQLSGRTLIAADRSEATMKEFFEYAALLMGARRPRTSPLWVARFFTGWVLCEMLSADLIAESSTLMQTGFAFRYGTYRGGLPPTLSQLGYLRMPSASEGSKQ